jgi:hypothetical protein
MRALARGREREAVFLETNPGTTFPLNAKKI